jgi:hypothetical protein
VAIRTVAERKGLPVEAVTEVRVLDPYFYGAGSAAARARAGAATGAGAVGGAR